MATKKVIALRGEPIVDEQNTASTAVLPGHLIEISSGQWRPHASASGAAAPWFALERDEMGKTIETAYAATDRVKAGFFTSGQRVNAVVASGDVIAEGAELESDGAGRLKAGTTKPVARAAEAHAAGNAADSHRLAVIVI